MGEKARAKDAVRALLDGLPEDCSLEDVIGPLLLLDGPWLDEWVLPPLTEAQRAALERL